MANNRKAKQATTYTYQSVDGSTSTIQVGQDGVTQQWIAFLKTDDAAILEQEDYFQKHLDYGYQNAVARYQRNPEEAEDHPINQYADPAADIFRILYPEEDQDSPLLEKVETAVAQLSDAQKDLILELYGMCRTVNEVAREQNVSHTAIQNRRTKIINRIKKIIESQMP